MKRRIMIGLHEMVEETEKGAYAVDMASEIKTRGYEPWIFADKMIENGDILKAHERNVKTTDIMHLGVQSLTGEFEAYVALDEWAQENVPVNLEMKKLIVADRKKSAEEVAGIVSEKIKADAKKDKLKDK